MIEINNVSKRYTNGVLSLDHVSLRVEKGSVLGLIGTNGAGKSTLLKLVSGIMTEDGGEILIDSERVFENSFVKSRLSFVSDEGYLLNNFTLEEMASIYASMRDNFSKKTFRKLCDSMRLDTKRKISTFSKGMKRQGEVILALSSGTEYIFFDETFDGLDPIARDNARRMIAEFVSNKNVTVILSSHNLAEIENICDSIALLDGGHLIFHKSVDEVACSLKKYQAVFENDVDTTLFDERFLKIKKSGKLITFISSLDEEELKKALSDTVKDPLIYLEGVQLTLDEIFALEVEKAHLERRFGA